MIDNMVAPETNVTPNQNIIRNRRSLILGDEVCESVEDDREPVERVTVEKLAERVVEVCILDEDPDVVLVVERTIGVGSGVGV